jgi:hypothetical protein
MITLPKFIFALVMGGLMSLTITLAISIVRHGIDSMFLGTWFGAWQIAYPVAIVCILLYRPFAEWVTTALVKRLK